MIKISLHKLLMFGFHGIHEEEKITGAEFEVNLDVCYKPAGPITSITQTIDYTVLYEIVKRRMQQPTELLETIGQDIVSEIKQKFPQVGQINITIGKINAPLTNFRGELSVSLTNE